MIRKAVIMAGGNGSRLRPLTSGQPKPMVRVVNVPCMEYIVRLLAGHGVEEIVVTLRFMAEEIRNYFGDGARWGVDISYSVEDSPAGTAGSVKLAEERLALEEDESFFVMSGDSLTDVDLTDLARYHKEKNSLATVVLKGVDNPLDFGMVITREDGGISRFLEKPAWGQVFSDTVSTGIYLLGPDALARIPDPLTEGESDFSGDVFPRLLDEGIPVYGYVTPGYWGDIGTLDQYATAQRDVLDGKVRAVRPPGARLRGSVYVGESSRLDEGAVEGPVCIGENVRVDPGAVIRPYTVLGDGVVVRAGAVVERSTIAEGTYIGEAAELRDTVVGRSCRIGARARLEERSSLGDGVVVGEGAFVGPGVKVYPSKTIEDGAQVTQSLIFETVGHRFVFRSGRVIGKFNVDITPEFLVRLASAFGTTLAPGSGVTVGRDASPASQVAKRATTSALLSTGLNVRDLRAAHAGVVRHDVLAGKSSAGIHLRSGADPDDLEMLFFSSGANPISEPEERAVERVFVSERYRRAYRDEIGELIYPGRVVEQYVERLERASDLARTSGATIVVDFAGGVADLVAGMIFSRLGINAVVLSGFSNANVARTYSGSDLLRFGDFEERLRRVGEVVRTVEADFGCIVGPTGEDVFFVDDAGERVPPDVMLACLLRLMRPERVILPVNLSFKYREIVESGGGRVYDSRMPLAQVAAKAAELHAELGARDDGCYVFPSFLPAPDCFITISCLLKFLKGANLSSVRREFGEAVGSVSRQTLDCPFAFKGRVMRELASIFSVLDEGSKVTLTDGVKILGENGDWVLMVPDPEQPSFHVFAESSIEVSSATAATETPQRYAEIIRETVQRTISDPLQKEPGSLL